MHSSSRISWKIVNGALNPKRAVFSSRARYTQYMTCGLGLGVPHGRSHLAKEIWPLSRKSSISGSLSSGPVRRKDGMDQRNRSIHSSGTGD